MGGEDVWPGVIKPGIHRGRRRWFCEAGRPNSADRAASRSCEPDGRIAEGADGPEQVALHGLISYVALRTRLRRSEKDPSRLRHQLEQGFHAAGAENLMSRTIRHLLTFAAVAMAWGGTARGAEAPQVNIARSIEALGGEVVRGP